MENIQITSELAEFIQSTIIAGKNGKQIADEFKTRRYSIRYIHGTLFKHKNSPNTPNQMSYNTGMYLDSTPNDDSDTWLMSEVSICNGLRILSEYKPEELIVVKAPELVRVNAQKTEE